MKQIEDQAASLVRSMLNWAALYKQQSESDSRYQRHKASQSEFLQAKTELMQYLADLTVEECNGDKPGPAPFADWGTFFNAMCWKMRPMQWGGQLFYTIIEEIKPRYSDNGFDPSIRCTMQMRMWPDEPEQPAPLTAIEPRKSQGIGQEVTDVVEVIPNTLPPGEFRPNGFAGTNGLVPYKKRDR